MFFSNPLHTAKWEDWHLELHFKGEVEGRIKQSCVEPWTGSSVKIQTLIL